MNQSKYKNIIFDLGAVLVNWQPEKIISDIFKEKQSMPIKTWKEILQHNIWNKMESGLLSKQDCLDQITQESKYDKKQLRYFFEQLPQHLYPLKRGIEIFNKIKKIGYKTYVLSNFAKELFQAAKELHNYSSFLEKFDGTVISYQTKSMKPEPKIYKILLAKYNLTPEHCLFIDDKEENILGAKTFKIDGIICKNHDYVLQELKKLNVI